MVGKFKLSWDYLLKPTILFIHVLWSPIHQASLLLGQITRKEPQRAIFTYDHCCKVTICTTTERLSSTLSGGMVGEDDEISREGKINLLAQRNKGQLLHSSVTGNPL